MGGITCVCVKKEKGSILINEFIDKDRIDPYIISLVKRIQTKWRTHFNKIQIKAAKSYLFSLEKLRPELKEILPDEFTLSLSPNVLNVLKVIGPFKLNPSEEAILTETKLYKLNPILFQNNIIYVGTWNCAGQRHGVGTMYLPEGGVFEGFFKNDVMCGRGRLINSEGDYYEGNFENEKANGYGKYVSAENVVYKGNWKDDKQEGKGEEMYPDKSVYIGEYHKGTKHGRGKFTWPDTSEYEGEFSENNLHGEGTYKWRDGRIYKGQWKNSKMEGHGEFSWPDNKRYVGQYKYDKKWGYGVFYWPNGKKYEGGWFNGKQHGLGILTINDIKKYGEWKMGKKLRWINENEGDYNKIIDEIKHKITNNEETSPIKLSKNDN
jgi:hypothetical protein